MTDLPAPGIHFGMSDEEYHAVPALSASGIKSLLVSPLDFWMRSWMNPDRKEDSDSTSRMLGNAYHKLILEGPEAFDAAYAVKPEADDYYGVLQGSEALRAECAARDLKKSGTLAEMAERIRQDQSEKGEDPADLPIWTEIMDQFEAASAGKIVLTRTQWTDLRKAAHVVAHMPSVKGLFTDGRAEVSIFWTHRSGVPMKARLDFLRIASVIDLKSFGNIMDKEIIQAVAGEVARNRYFIQPVVYLDAVAEAKRMFARHGFDAVHGEVDRSWIEKVMATPEHRFAFVFQQTGDVPNCIVREFARVETHGGQGQTTNAYWTKGAMSYDRGVEAFQACMKHFGPDVPWIIDHGVKAFRDDQFPIWMLETPANPIGEAA